jgi:hypothetical protein
MENAKPILHSKQDVSKFYNHSKQLAVDEIIFPLQRKGSFQTNCQETRTF